MNTNAFTLTLIRVARDEMTCLGCGETFPASGYCMRCGVKDDNIGKDMDLSKQPPAVPTISYLHEDEYTYER